MPKKRQYQGPTTAQIRERNLTAATVAVLLDPIKRAIALAGIEQPRYKPHDYQLRPIDPHFIWLFMAGRDAGKTWISNYYIIDHLQKYKDKAWVTMGAPTRQDCVSTCLEGKSGLLTLYGSEFDNYNRSELTLRHKGGGRVRAISGEVPNRFRGPQHSLLVLDEFSLFLKSTVDNALFGLRIKPGPSASDDPWALFAFTPIARQLVKDFVSDPRSILTTATTFNNPDAPQATLDYLKEKYEGTRLGRQELYGELLEDVEGALFKREWIERSRVKEAPELNRISIWIDPAVTANKKSAETGITVAGSGEDKHAYILANTGEKADPVTWGLKVWEYYFYFQADFIGYETNQGGDFIEQVLLQALEIFLSRHPEYSKVRPKFEQVHAKRGKFLRADPVALLYEQGRVHHVGIFPELEDQMCSFTPSEGQIRGEKLLLDRLDSMVYAVLSLAGKPKKRAMVASV